MLPPVRVPGPGPRNRHPHGSQAKKYAVVLSPSPASSPSRNFSRKFSNRAMFFEACRFGDYPAVEQHLRYVQARLSITDQAEKASHSPAVHYAVEGGPTVLRLLLRHGFNPNVRLIAEGDVPLITAIKKKIRHGTNSAWHRYDALDILDSLIDARAQVNLHDDKGRTALWWAAKFNYRAAVERLLSFGADPRLRDKHGVSPSKATSAEGVSVLLCDDGAMRKLMQDNMLPAIEDAAEVNAVEDGMVEDDLRGDSDVKPLAIEDISVQTGGDIVATSPHTGRTEAAAAIVVASHGKKSPQGHANTNRIMYSPTKSPGIYKALTNIRAINDDIARASPNLRDSTRRAVGAKKNRRQQQHQAPIPHHNAPMSPSRTIARRQQPPDIVNGPLHLRKNAARHNALIERHDALLADEPVRPLKSFFTKNTIADLRSYLDDDEAAERIRQKGFEVVDYPVHAPIIVIRVRGALCVVQLNPLMVRGPAGDTIYAE
eukprot:GEMP01039601.1.p1 GENE.GEMP01039601.1~~GEMP01039601.1.p1  ORF type:complete len:487 (+),score=92.78 GEMP01039601.1:399-1859(+)